MKSLLFAIGLFCFSAYAEELGVEVTDIQDPMVRCPCDNPGEVGRICINTTKWAHDEYPREGDEDLTQFVPSIQGNDFVLTSIALYNQCNYGKLPFIFTNPAEQAKYPGDQFAPVGYKGRAPTMKVGIFNNRGQAVYSPLLTGTWTQKEFYYQKGKPGEFRRTQYPGITEYRTKLETVLTDFQVRMILDDGHEEIKYAKAILAVDTIQGGTKAFGEYTIKLRFFRKPGVTLKDRWDISAIKVETLAL